MVLLPSLGLSFLLGLMVRAFRPPFLGVDAARPGSYKVQPAPVPMAGLLCLPLPVFLFAPPDFPLLASLVLAACLGWIDDRRKGGFPWKAKLAGQFLAAGVFLAAGGFEACSLWLLPWLVLCMNAWNFLDNSDGVAGMTALGALGPLLCLAAPSPLALALAGGLLGFLPLNWPRARIYLGDAGAHALGLLMGVLSLRLIEEGDLASALALQAVPFLDLVQVLCLRASLGIPPWKGDRRHLAHRLSAVLPPVLLAPLFLLLAALPPLLLH